MAAKAEPSVHTYLPSKATPGTCVVCGLIRKNGRHPRGGAEPEPTPDVQQRAAGEARRSAGDPR